MALTLKVEAPRAISLDEYLHHVHDCVNPADRDSVLESAIHLHALSRNRALLLDILHEDLKSSISGTDSRFYTAHSFILGSAKGMTVRGNIWPTVCAFQGSPHRREHVNKVYAYEYPHDHNFDFLTAGWFGPGYITDIYEYEYTSVEGIDGEVVHLKFLERTALPDGKVMFFREGQDVHIQLPPPSISVSLNLLVRTPLTGVREQFIFDIERKQIAGMATGSDVARTVLAIQFTAVIGDASSIKYLDDLATDSKNGRVRAAALAAMLELAPELEAEVARKAECDTSAHVQQLARERGFK